MKTKIKTEGRGGARPGAGRKQKDDALKKHSKNVYLLDAQRSYLVDKFGSLTEAIKTLLPKDMRY